MAKLQNGIYIEKQKKTRKQKEVSLARKLSLRGELRTTNSKRLKISDEAHRQAQLDLLKLRNM